MHYLDHHEVKLCVVNPIYDSPHTKMKRWQSLKDVVCACAHTRMCIEICFRLGKTYGNL